ncbi:lipoprotein [Actinorhabdospora filicis]|uniref:Lipoprotein n=1 Tax=Actinorhabdospora filicis TaxID=1785913 RepID=A0A9W6STN9_9ACTN|nr:iron uptake system protein EfeO [Actinorhabdospora filicis]GLZ81774.1 lipoprotein [Actinorhabdospora filicis]
MNTPRTRMIAAGAFAATAVLGLAACGDKADDKGGASNEIAVTATDSECKLDKTQLSTGNYTFVVENKGAQVTEFYIYGENDVIVGEVENVAPGLTRKLSVPLKSGTFQGTCKPGMVGDGIRTPITVTGDDAVAADDAELSAAVATYKTYVATQADELVKLTEQFTTAVKKGDLDEAKRLYPLAREPWERIEPVAEIFGDLDPLIDGREADLAQGQEFTGFHKLEKDLWIGKDIKDSGPIADRLIADVKTIAEKAKGAELSAAQVGNGAKELLDEVAATKMTGEEDVFSHTDLWDINANVSGAQQAIEALRPVLAKRDAAFLGTLDTAFKTVNDTLAKYKSGDGWKLHNELTQTELKELSDVVNALAEPLSHVGAKVLPTQ